MSLRYFLLIAIMLAMGGSNFTQVPVLEQLGPEKGLSQGFVTSIIQDHEGFIWAGTMNGLNRYDGYRFQVFNNNPFDPFSLSLDFVSFLFEKGDYLLVGTYGGGLNIFHKKTQRFFRVPCQAYRKNAKPTTDGECISKLPAEHIADVIIDDKGNLWVTVFEVENKGKVWICRMEVPKGFWENLPNNPQLVEKIGFRVWQAPDWGDSPFWITKVNSGGGEIYWRNYNGLYKLDDKDCHWLRQADLSTGAPNCLVWLGNGKERLTQTPDFSTYYCDGNGRCFQIGKLKGNIFQRDGENLWVHEPHSISCYKVPQIGPQTDLSGAPRLVELPLQDERLRAMIDRSGNVWYTDRVGGLLHFSPIQTWCQHFFKGESIMTRPFMSQKQTAAYFKVPVLMQEKAIDDDLNALEGNNIRMGLNSFIFLTDEKGNYWEAGYAGPNKQAFLVKKTVNGGGLDILPVPKLTGATKCAVFDGDGKLWFGLDGHLASFDPTKRASDEAWGFYNFREATHIESEPVYLEKTKDGSWWLATANGLVQAIPTGAGFDFKVHRNEPKSRNTLWSNDITSMLADPLNPQLLWISTRGGGLSSLDITTGKAKTLTTKDGLPSNVIYGVLTDYNDLSSPTEPYHLWLSTNRGIVKFAPATGQLQVFKKVDGLQSDEFNSHAFSYSDAFHKKGKLMFGGINGLNVFDPQHVKGNRFPPRVHITGLKLNDGAVSVLDSGSVLKEAIEFANVIKVPYSQNSISLEFSALDFTATTKNQYRYWLEGFEKQWAHTSFEPSARYIGLPPGEYRFIVYGSNNDGVWGELPATLTIVVLPPWYRTKLAFAFYCLVLLGLLYWLLRHYQLRAQAREARYELKIHKVKLEDYTKLLLEKSRLIEEFLGQNKGGIPSFVQEVPAPFEEEHSLLSEGISIGQEAPAHQHIALHELQILTKEDWEHFLEMFELANPGFLADLNERFPQLTPAEIRLLLLTKIGLGKNEIADMLGISPESVKKTRYRIRKKLGTPGQALEHLFEMD